MGGARKALDLDVHHAGRDEGQHFPEEILVGALLKQLLHRHSVDGHGCGVLSVRVWKPEPTAESAHDLDLTRCRCARPGERASRGVPLRSAYGLSPRNAATVTY